MRMRFALPFYFMLLAACSSAPKTPDALGPEVALFDGHTRLPDSVRPLRYDLRFTIDPAEETFAGVARIEVETVEPTRAIAMHADELSVRSARVEGAGEPIGARLVEGTNGGATLALEREIEPGTYAIVLEYEAPLDESPEGLYRVKEGESWYAFTQFEPLEAREAFPGFDEPRFKTPYEVTIRAPSGLVAAANGPKTGESSEGAWTAHTFKVTEPLPTYLVAVAVGDFDIVEAPSTEGQPPLRVLATKGKGEMAQYALEQTPKILSALSDYFGQPYPFAKLDLVAVPNFAAGAMENVGLVTFRETLLLVDAESAAANVKFAASSVIAHELAHMWFGNLVTPLWWDELWLNESFATWMAARITDEVDPKFGAKARRLRSTARAMAADSLTDTRAIRQPIETGGDIYNAFDGITYAKGAAVLRMIESWVGEEAFRAGIREALEQNAYGHLTTPKLIAALKRATDKPVGEVLAAFIDRPGVPLLAFEPVCENDRASVRVTQSRYVPAGSGAPQNGPWKVPACIKAWRGGEAEITCALIDQESETIALKGAGCPSAIHPNAEEAGYYHWSLPPEAMSALATEHQDKLSEFERKALLGHMTALVRARALDPGALWRAAGALTSSEDAGIVAEAIRALSMMDPLAEELELREQYASFMSERLAPTLSAFELEPEPGEPTEIGSLRPVALWALGDLADSAYVMINAKGLLQLFLEDPDQVPDWRSEWAIPLAATEGDRHLWDGLKRAALEAKSPIARARAVRALGSFRDPEQLRRTLAFYFDPSVRSNEFWSLVGPSFYERDLFTEVTWPWFTANFDAIVAKIGDKDLPDLPWVGSGFCSPEGAQKVAAFFEPADRFASGTERNLAMTLESIGTCAAVEDFMRDSVREALRTKGEARDARSSAE